MGTDLWFIYGYQSMDHLRLPICGSTMGTDLWIIYGYQSMDHLWVLIYGSSMGTDLWIIYGYLSVDQLWVLIYGSSMGTNLWIIYGYWSTVHLWYWSMNQLWVPIYGSSMEYLWVSSMDHPKSGLSMDHARNHHGQTCIYMWKFQGCPIHEYLSMVVPAWSIDRPLFFIGLVQIPWIPWGYMSVHGGARDDP